MDNKLSEAEKIINDMSKNIEVSIVEDMIKDNKIPFIYEEKEYRVRLLNRVEKEELDMLRRKKFGALLKDSDILLEKDLILQLKKRDINVDEIDADIKKLEAQERDVQIKLGESLAKNEGETIFNIYKEQIENFRIDKQIKAAQKTILLEFSLENQLLNYVAEIITYLSLEVKNEAGRWQRMFKSLDDFRAYTDEKLITQAGAYAMILQYF
jgi:hypothetical protein